MRPVKNPHDKIELYLGIKLSQISDIVSVLKYGYGNTFNEFAEVLIALIF